MSKYVTGEKLLLSINGILNMHLYDKQTIINLFFLICSLVTRPDNCSFINGEYLKSGLEKLEKWCCETKEEYAGSSWDELKHTRQAVGFLLIHKKYNISYDEIANDLCPVSLSINQLFYR
jgi:myosin-5